jgi:hypothetical protein
MAAQDIRTLKYSFDGVLLLLFISFVLTLYEHRAVVYDTLTTYIPQEEHFTELYFNDPTELPENAEPGETVTFTFTIHSLENTDKNYTFITTFTSKDGRSYPIDERSILITHDEYQVYEESFQLPVDYEQGVVSVTIPEIDQHIHFWLYNS